MRFLASVGLLVTGCMTGCMYWDPIVQPRTVFMELLEPTASELYRGGTVKVSASFAPLHDGGTYAWSAVACERVERGTGIGCAGSPFDTGDAAIWVFEIPAIVDPRGVPVQAIIVTLEARDDRGVFASTSQFYRVNDRPPTLELRKSAHSFTVGAPIDLFAKCGDPDDPASSVVLDWKVFTPSTQPGFALTDLTVAPDLGEPDHVTRGKRFVAHGAGDWDVQVIARDRFGQMIERHLPITVAPDRPPCFAHSQPIVPADGESLPVTEPTVFQVARVDDDLDSYPPTLGDPVFGTPTFAWSILPPGAPVRQPLVGATGNSIDFDPDAFTPGDIVEIRVEIFDRNQIAIPCVDSAPACSVIAQPLCLQRQTWRVEVR